MTVVLAELLVESASEVCFVMVATLVLDILGTMLRDFVKL
jgi:hypothetical protein